MFNALGVGDSVHESRDSHALQGSLDMPTLSLESLHEIFCRFLLFLLDVLSTDSEGRSSNHTLADTINVELNMWPHVGIAHRSTFAAA
ncbi:hypothetical protein Tco_0042341 [Tanacetum coccineum]